MQDKTRMKFWISKYALTKGIYEIEGTYIDTLPETVMNLNNVIECYYGEGKEYHKTKEEAIKMADAMRKSKIDSLKEQIVKFENMKFN